MQFCAVQGHLMCGTFIFCILRWSIMVRLTIVHTAQLLMFPLMTQLARELILGLIFLIDVVSM
ncbi:hypothetical protein GQ600_8254 [Phytophthora cactorum]|nr:hypothetical protein GQ600_8254 [Phytophthora cactorum]